MYDSVHNLNKYSLSKFYEISSIHSKYGTINRFYKDLVKLNDVKSRGDAKKPKKADVVTNILQLYYE